MAAAHPFRMRKNAVARRLARCVGTEYDGAMGNVPAATRLTAEVLYDLPDDRRRYELVEGCLVSEPLPGMAHGFFAARLLVKLSELADSRGLGVVVADVGFLLARDPDTVRGPDVAFVSKPRIEATGLTLKFFPGAPDLAVEVLSPSNRPQEIRAKVADYLAAGSRCVWVVDPKRRTVTAYRELLAPRTFGAEDALECEDLLPGFSLRVGEVFEL